MSRKHLADKPISNGTATTSLGISNSAHITTDSSGHFGADSHSLFSDAKSSKGWSSKTDATVDLVPDRR